MMSYMSNSEATKESQATPRNCWDYSEKELREMPDEQAEKILTQQMEDNGRKAREAKAAQAQ
jgi:hypothetical protein